MSSADLELESCRERLAEAEAILDAIRRGRIDAVVVDSPEGSRIFTVAGAERPYRVFIEQMGEGAASLSTEGTILFANKQFAHLLRLPAEAVTGRRLTDFLGTDDGDRLRAAFSSRTAEHKRMELDLRREDGSHIPVYLSASIFEEDGLRTACVIASDLTEQKQAEEQLRQSQKMEAIGQLTTGIAHDFNNLLTAILGNLDLMERRSTDGEMVQRIQRTASSALRGAKLVEQLLAFARRQHLIPQRVDVNRVVTDILALIGRTIGPAIAVNTRLEGGVLEACADTVQLEMMLLNLALNSRDAMPRGGTLRIETTGVTAAGQPWVPADLAPGPYVRISVIDTGVGMSSETRSRAVEPFFTTKRAGAGSGLGLSQVYGVAKQFGGSIHIESEPGRGTAVHVYLPRAVTAGEEVEPPQRGQAVPRPARGAVVVVVDDEPEIRQLCVDLLSALGHRALEADGGTQALDLLRRQTDADLLFTDIAMPGMNGFELAQQARKLRPDLPILLMTGYADFAELQADALSLPVLKKPFRIEELAPLVEQLLHAHDGA